MSRGAAGFGANAQLSALDRIGFSPGLSLSRQQSPSCLLPPLLFLTLCSPHAHQIRLPTSACTRLPEYIYKRFPLVCNWSASTVSIMALSSAPSKVVAQWQECLRQNLKACVTVNEETTLADGTKSQLHHIVPYLPSGQPMKGRTGEKQFRVFGRRGNIVLGLYEEERRHDPTLTASHLCHRGLTSPLKVTLCGKEITHMCVNPAHICAESLAANKSRNGCPGPGAGCKHVPECIRPGPYHDAKGIQRDFGFAV